MGRFHQYINTLSHVANSNSQEEFFHKVMEDVKRLQPKINTPTKAKKLIKEVVFNAQVRDILDI